MLTKWYIDFFKWQLHVLSIEMLFNKIKPLSKAEMKLLHQKVYTEKGRSLGC